MQLDGETVADHPRSFKRDQVVYDPWHYLPVLMRKSGASFKDWDLPAPLTAVREKLRRHADDDRQFVKFLGRVPEDGIAAVAEACTEALAAGIASGDVVMAILARRRQPPVPQNITTPDALKLRPSQSPTAPDTTTCPGEGKLPDGKSPTDRGDGQPQALWHARQLRRDSRQGPEPARGDRSPLASLVRAELTPRQSRSINYRISGARFPVLQDIDAFVFENTPVDEGQIRDLAGDQRVSIRAPVRERPFDPAVTAGTGDVSIRAPVRERHAPGGN